MGKLFREGMAMGSERDGTLLVLLSCARRGNSSFSSHFWKARLSSKINDLFSRGEM